MPSFPAGEVESGKRLCVVPGGKKGTEEQHMGHASHVLCMAISSDGKYLVWGEQAGGERGLVLPHGVQRWLWGVHLLLESSVSCPDVPCWVKVAQSQEWVPWTPKARGVGMDADGLWVPKGRVLGIPCCLTGHRRQEQADHDLGHSYLQAPAHLHWAP